MSWLYVSTSSAKAGNSQPLWDVFLIVPIVKLLAALLSHVIPDNDRACAH
jgi:hypothetical protein